MILPPSAPGLTSASSASKAFAGNFAEAFGLSIGDGLRLTAVAIAFMTLIVLVNFRGVGESVKLNVVLTCVELTGLLIVICIGAWALGGGKVGAPAFPITIFAFITMFAVANSALINMLMASRLLYGMANERVLPRVLGRVHRTRRTPWVGIMFTTLIAFGLIWFADLTALGGTTSLLLLCVFTIVNIAVLVLRGDPVEHKHFRAPTAIPVAGAIVCAYLASPLSGRASADYKVAGVLLVIGVVLWAITYASNRFILHQDTTLDPSHLSKK